MKDTTPRLPNFHHQFAYGALAFSANSNSAAHGAEMDAPEILPAGGWMNAATCQAYPLPFMSLARR